MEENQQIEDEVQKEANSSLGNFFKYLGVGFVMSLFKVKIYGTPLRILAEASLITFAQGLISGVFLGIGAMIAIDVYSWFKKKHYEEAKIKRGKQDICFCVYSY